jgi:hypothetical protein
MFCFRHLCRSALFVLVCSGIAFSQSNQGPTNFSGSTSTQIVSVQQNGGGYALTANTNSAGPVGAVFGQARASSGFNNGVWGRSFSNAGVGVRGEAMSANGGTGVAGFAVNSVAGIGVYGHAYKNGFGVMGMIDSQDFSGAGIFGKSGNSCCGIPGLFEQDATNGGGYNVILLGQYRDTNNNLQTALEVDTQGLYAYQIVASPNPLGGDLFVGEMAPGKNVFRVDKTGAVYADGGYHTGGADFAESVASKGATAQYAAGDVLVIDADGDRRLARANEPYSTTVAGIYSTKPGMLASPHALSQAASSEVPLAVVGIVPCKVSASNGAIHRGDLLVTSSKAGYAMKGTDRSRMVGAIVGKALQPLPKGDGLIEVLITLQ